MPIIVVGGNNFILRCLDLKQRRFEYQCLIKHDELSLCQTSVIKHECVCVTQQQLIEKEDGVERHEIKHSSATGNK